MRGEESFFDSSRGVHHLHYELQRFLIFRIVTQDITTYTLFLKKFKKKVLDLFFFCFVSLIVWYLSKTRKVLHSTTGDTVVQYS